MTARLPDPYGYGRIVRDEEGRLSRIVEQRDASAEQQEVNEINSGIYAFELGFPGALFSTLHNLATDNAQGEYYLTDVIAAYYRDKRTITTLQLDNADELRGVNSRVDLADLTSVIRSRKNHEVMLAGATLEDPASTLIDADVTIGPDTIIGPSVRLEGGTTIGERCRIRAGSRITNSTIGDDVTVLDYCVIVDSAVDARAHIGPFSHLRPGS